MRYLDNAATTPVLDQVVEAMLPYLKGTFGNPSSVYALGRDAKKGIEEARERVAAAIGAQPSEVIFTAGGTEADNQAVKGTALKNRGRGNHIITSAVEHHAVLHSVAWLQKSGFEVTYVPVDANGLVDPGAVADQLRRETILVSVMMANNEVGTIEPLSEIVSVVRDRSTALIHTDAVQALGKIPVDVAGLGIDLASFSAHKLGGPKGTGALFVRQGVPLETFLHGGGQERDLRSGTPNVAGIVGFSVAAQVGATELEHEMPRLEKLRDRLQEGIDAAIDGVIVNAAGAPRVPGTLNVCIKGVQGEGLLLMLDSKGIAASSGSACTSGSLDPSHVLTAMGVPADIAAGSLRLSLGRSNTEEDADVLLEALPTIVERLRAVKMR